jgi:hypothetical protein
MIYIAQKRSVITMKFNTQNLLFLILLTSLIIPGCNSNNQTIETPSESPVNEAVTEIQNDNGHPPVSQGGQVVEVGKYHLELVAIPEPGGAHLDFYLQTGDDHENIPDAKVMAELQFPDGTEKTLELPYDAPGEHYATVLSTTIRGQYQMRITAEVAEETVTGRFTFEL